MLNKRLFWNRLRPSKATDGAASTEAAFSAGRSELVAAGVSPTGDGAPNRPMSVDLVGRIGLSGRDGSSEEKLPLSSGRIVDSDRSSWPPRLVNVPSVGVTVSVRRNSAGSGPLETGEATDGVSCLGAGDIEETGDPEVGLDGDTSDRPFSFPGDEEAKDADLSTGESLPRVNCSAGISPDTNPDMPDARGCMEVVDGPTEAPFRPVS